MVCECRYGDTDEFPYRSPATIDSVRPVTLRPYLSISLPSERRLLENRYFSQNITDEWLNLRMSGTKYLHHWLNQTFFRK